MSHLPQRIAVDFHLADVGGYEVLPLVILMDKDIVLATLVRDDGGGLRRRAALLFLDWIALAPPRGGDGDERARPSVMTS